MPRLDKSKPPTKDEMPIPPSMLPPTRHDDEKTRQDTLTELLELSQPMALAIRSSFFSEDAVVEVASTEPSTVADLVALSPENEFIIGPLLKSGSEPIAAWFEQNAIERGTYHGEEFPASPNGVPDYDYYINLNYYDQCASQYAIHHSTGDPKFLGYARKIADSWWAHSAIKSGEQLDFGYSFAPRNVSLNGLILRALDGKPEMWPWITEYTRAMYDIWLGARLDYTELHYGIRDGGYSLLFVANLARVHPTAAVRAEMKKKAVDAAVKYYARLQKPDGAFVWSDDSVEFYGQPFQHPILAEGLIAAHRLIEGDASLTTEANTIKVCILKIADYLYTIAFNRKPVTDYAQKPDTRWMAMRYYTHQTWCPADNPHQCNDPDISNNWDVYVFEQRQLNATSPHVFGYAFKISGDEKYRTQGDEVFKATYQTLDGLTGLAYFRAKEFNQSYRAGFKYLAWRLGGVGTPPPPPPPPTAEVFSVTGKITSAAGEALAGVKLVAEKTDRSSALTKETMTGNGGAYSLTDLPRGHYILTPTLAGYTFAPDRVEGDLTQNLTLDFTSTRTTTPPPPPPPPTGEVFPVTGKVMSVNGEALAGVRILAERKDKTVLFFKDTVTGNGGEYSLSDLPRGHYILTPSLSGYTFAPEHVEGDLIKNETIDFTATRTTTPPPPPPPPPGGATFNFNETVADQAGSNRQGRVATQFPGTDRVIVAWNDGTVTNVLVSTLTSTKNG